MAGNSENDSESLNPTTEGWLVNNLQKGGVTTTLPLAINDHEQKKGNLRDYRLTVKCI